MHMRAAGKLRAELREEFENKLIQMEKAVEISETKEQRFVLDKKERYLTDMAALRKETILKFQLKTWAVKPTPDGIRADQMEVALSYAKVGRVCSIQ